MIKRTTIHQNPVHLLVLQPALKGMFSHQLVIILTMGIAAIVHPLILLTTITLIQKDKDNINDNIILNDFEKNKKF